MPITCTVCSKKYYSTYQDILQCTTCDGWVHHGNRLDCSGLTDIEFEYHVQDEHKPFECQKCFGDKNAKSKNSIFSILPFPVECEDNPFGKPVSQPKPDISSLNPSQLKTFIEHCEKIQDQLKSNNEDDIDDNDLSSTAVNSKYYNIKQLNSLKPGKSSFGILHVNIASLDAHIDDLRTFLSRSKINFDVIGISEHKIKKNSPPSNNIKIIGYNEFEFEPTGTTHGGTGFYIKQGLNYKIRDELNINIPGQFEAIFSEIILPDRKNLIVGCLYRHPSSPVSVRDFTSEHLEPILNKISKEKKEIALMGDFNIDLLKTSSNNSAGDFFNNLSSHFFTPFVLQPSRLKSKTLIDNIFLNSLEYQSNSGNLLLELADHLMQFVILEDFAKKVKLSQANIYKRDMSNFNEREFEETVVKGTNWENVCAGGLQSFYEKIVFHLDEMAPLKKVTLKEQRLMLKPWITRDILEQCKKGIPC